MPITRRQAMALAAAAPAIVRAAPRRPNILFFLTDDQRHDALSCAGNPILRTPHLDRLASEGVRFANAFVTNSLCSPSRGTLITGLYSHAHGVRTNGGTTHRLLPGVPLFPRLLQQAGYYTAITGKWHMASPPEGFDHTCVLPGQGLYHDPIFLANGARVKMRGYVDDVVADQAIETLRNRPKDRPFCLLCWFKAPHRSWQNAARHDKLFEDIEIPEPSTFHTSLDNRPPAIRDSDIQIADMPDFQRAGVARGWPRARRKTANFQQFLKHYYRVLTAVDENVGRLLEFLDEQKLASDTLVLHSSDNGFFTGEYGLFDKRMMYEPSIRVPLLARYPAGFAGGRIDSRHMVLNNDIAHTLLDYAQARRPASMEGHGESIRPLLENRPARWRDAWMYEYFEYPAITCTGKMRGIRTARWKLIHYIQQPEGWELFDLEKDPEERHNLYGQAAHQATFEQLRARLEAMRDELKDDRSEDGVPAPPCTIRIADLPWG